MTTRTDPFNLAYPSYAATRALDDLRQRNHPLLDGLGHVYLDYTAGNLVPLGLVERHASLLRDHVLGNPHSTNPASALTTTFVEQARESVLEFFADPTVVVVFLPTPPGAEAGQGSYPFGPDGGIC
jgi:selenocysteine lyase/cysteine desulfurase